MRIDLKTILIFVSIIVGAIIMRPAPDSKLLEKHLLQENIDLSDSLKAREVEIEKIKSDIKKLHKDEEEKLGTLPDAPIDTLDAIWARFFDKYSY